MRAALVGAALLAALLVASAMRTDIKKGVIIRRILPEMEPVIRAAREAFAKVGAPAEITGAWRQDPSSKHSEDLALDYKVKHIAPTLWETVALDIAILIGPAFDVVLERDTSTAPLADENNSHIHVEYDPAAWKSARSYGFSVANI